MHLLGNADGRAGSVARGRPMGTFSSVGEKGMVVAAAEGTTTRGPGSGSFPGIRDWFGTGVQ
jgi:hypothetical protein